MSAQPPIHCLPAAWEMMRAQLPRLETTDGLLGAALGIALHGDPAMEPERVEIEIDRIVQEIRRRLRSDDRRAVIAHAHAVLFDEMDFRGDAEDYYDPGNSYLHEVLRRRRGLPITLVLLYKLVLEPLGLRVVGINAPGHFLARVESDSVSPALLVDPFDAGRALSVDEAVARARQITVAFDASGLVVATHRQWLQRILRNLIGVFHERRRAEDRAAMEELSRLLS